MIFHFILIGFFIHEIYGKFALLPPYNTDYKCDNLNDVLQIRNKSIVENLVVSNVSDVTICDFPLLEGFDNLDHIELESGVLTKVTQECFKGASKLTTITVSNQELVEFELDESIRLQIQMLGLDENKLKEFSFEDKLYPKLRYLSLMRNNLTKFSLRSNQAPNLWKINLFGNKIEKLNIEAESLMMLTATDNRIKSLNENEINAPESTIMHFDFNNLTTISSKFLSRFPKLETMSLERNPIYFMDLSSMNISSLKCYSEEITLELENRVKGISISVLWDSVRVLNYSNNKIKNLTIFQQEIELKIEELILRDNLIEKIGQNDLHLLEDLIIIDLSNNNIASIEENAFSRNSNLHTLLLKGNKLQSMALSILEPLKSLVFIDLSNNQLKSFPVPNLNDSLQSYHPLLNVRGISLEGNPICCSNQRVLHFWMSTYNKFVFQFEFNENCDNL